MRVLFLIGILVLLSSCFDNEPETYQFDNPLVIESLEVFFKENRDGIDSLWIEFVLHHQFEYGLNDEDQPPFHRSDTVYDADNNLVKYGSNPTFPLHARKLDGTTYQLDWDSIPDFCLNVYSIVSDNYSDTLVVNPNVYFHNLYVTFLDESGQDILTELFDCVIVDFNARFPYVPYTYETYRDGTMTSFPFAVDILRKHKRKIKYSMYSRGWKAILNEKFQVQVQVNDRELNISDIYETDLVTLEEITVTD